MAKGMIQQAAEQQAQQAAIRTRDVIRKLRVEVSQEDRDYHAKRLAEAAIAVNLLEAQRTDTTADFNRRIKKQKGVMEEAALIVQDGLRDREVRCVQEFDDVKARPQ